MQRVLFALIVAVLGVPLVANAQGFEIDGIHARAKDPDLIGARWGVGAVLRVPVAPHFPLRGRIEAQRIAGSRDVLRGTCTGLVPIEADCSPEPSTTTSRLEILGLGAELTALRWRRMDLLLNAELLAAKAHANTVGRRSGGSLTGDASMKGMVGGAEVAWQPVPRAALAITAGAQFGTISRINHDFIIDGYNPYTNPVSLQEFKLGIGWRPSF